MIWTLYRYLSRELLKTAAVAVVAFTLVMTMFAVIAPMRKNGLGPVEVLKLFWYTLPLMLSLTLPFAALFAATIVYGRFSMANELTACRASGISSLRLLKPGMAMGLAVTGLSLLLSFWVAPSLARRGEDVGRANLQSLVFQHLRTRGYYRDRGQRQVLHADIVDPQNHTLGGVVALSYKDSTDVRFVVASSADVRFEEEFGELMATITPVNPVAGSQSGAVLLQMGQATLSVPVPRLFDENPSFYDWDQLRRVLHQPQESQQVQRRLERIRRQLHETSLYEAMAEQINAGKGYEMLFKGRDPYVFRAPAATVERGRRLVLHDLAAPEPGARPIEVLAFNHLGRLEYRIRAGRAQINASQDLTLGGASIKADLTDVTIEWIAPPGQEPEEPRHRQEYRIGPLDTPDDVRLAATQVRLEDLYWHPEAYPAVGQELAAMKYDIQRLTAKIKAEMHGRTAFAVGCFLLVAIGSSLGLIYRGGQVLSAFALSCAPAMVLIVMGIMGRQLMGQLELPMLYGQAAIWGGVGVLVVLAALLLAKLARQ